MVSPLHFVVDPADLGVSAFLVVRGYRDVVESDAVPLDEGLEVLMIRDHAGNFDVEFLRLPARQQVVQAVFLFADHQHHASPDCRVADLPVHRQLGGQRREALAEFGQVERQ
jgi:hypothetical protein